MTLEDEIVHDQLAEHVRIMSPLPFDSIPGDMLINRIGQLTLDIIIVSRQCSLRALDHCETHVVNVYSSLMIEDCEVWRS